MTKYWLNVALLRVVLPVILAGCTIWRPVGLSIIYLVLMLYSPMVPIPTHETMAGHTGIYLKICICLAFIVAIAQITFHIVLLSLPPYGYFLQNCEFLEKLFRHIGFVRLDSASVWEIFYWLTPEFLILPTVLAIYFICRFLTQKRNEEENEPSPREENKQKKTKDSTTKIINFLGGIGTYVVLASLCCVAALTPSIEAAFYFLVFLGAATCWACNKELQKKFAVICRIIMIIVIVHIVVLLAYQNEWPQEIIPASNAWSRYLALTAIYHTNCSDPRDVEYTNNADWLIYGYVLRLFWLYYVLALQSQFLSKKPLMRFGSGRTGLLQDSTTGSIIVQDGHQDDSIQMQSLSEGVPDDTPGIIEQIIMAVYSIFQLIVNSSYLATNIIMMTWSIMYHSWTTFVLLLWALILWMVPDKRASMMKCSPFIVFYATLLLLGQYVYSMDLNDEELPTVVSGVKISEIGFSKADELSRWHLIVKCLFISMFWITMRQYMAERKRQQRSSTLRDMVAPLHVSVSTATTAMSHDESEIKSKFMKNVGELLHNLLTKFWIAVVAIMLFICGITGERMTVFRIVYMSLFLIFVITFQMSWRVWRRMMYVFWVTVIAYSIAMLILVYTYQFQNFPKYWEYLGIDQDLQMDIGLEIYEIKDLFVRLLTPTFFVIITVLQIHYFHKEFLNVTNIDRLGPESSFRRASLGYSPSLNIPVSSPADVTLTENENYTMYTLKQLKHMSKLERIALFRKITKHLINFYNYTWLFLEIHMQKIVFISFVLLCINDVCAINFFFIVAVVVMINFKRNIQINAINIMAAIISLLVVAKMLYQIQYINHDNWNVNCTRYGEKDNQQYTSNNTVYNIAEWFGMKKAEPGGLPDLLKGYIGIVTVTTFRKIIRIRQWFHRHSKGESLDTPQIMFPNITRADADKGLPECLKFLFNYGFYKFGLEICFIGIVTLIGTRLDFYSVLYSMWLLLFFSLKRKTVARIWPCFRIFAITFLPIQYAIVVAPPTWLCIEYPWSESEVMRRLQEWMFFPDPDFPPNSKKLICDFLLLMMIVRQSLVFHIEQQSLQSGREFVAGHNYSVFQDMEKPNFVNPIKDYVSHIQSWLDIIKRGCMMSLMWVTLSIMFLAGTKRTNLFSLGYLIGAFVFLWQGSDFYLRPMKVILKWWNLLIGYNVIVIFLKAVLQGVGCVLIKDLGNSACWLVQLLGIACLKKFKSSSELLDSECNVAREDIGMVWDGLCLCFLLIQKRLFKSYYFFHIVDETKAMSILASRGAELLEELHQKRIDIQENVEKTVLEKLKFKMDKIKANQQKIQKPDYRELQAHKVDELYPGTRPLYKIRTPKTNREAIRSGDYYMFDDLDDDDVTDLVPDSEAEKKEKKRFREQEQRQRRMTVSEGPDRTSLTSVEMEDKEATDLAKTPEISSDEEEDKSKDKKEDKEKEEQKKASFFTYFKFLLVMINSTLTSMTKYLNQFSHDYRYIRKVLAREKKSLKAKPDFRMGTRLGINQMWQPIPLIQERLATNGNTEESLDPGEGPSQPCQEESTLFSQALAVQQDEEIKELSEVDQPPIIQLAASIWFGILAHSNLLCYFMVFLHQIKNASVLSTPLPFMVFLWGTLTIPRPSKTFWVTLIAYVEAIVIIKCIFQLELISPSRVPNNPLYIPRIMGVLKKPNYALWDLLLLLMLFFHRLMLKSLGQWTSSFKQRKIIPSQLPVSSKLPSSDKEQEESSTQKETNSHAEIKTSQERSLNVHARDDTHDVPPTTDDNEKLIIAQGEINPQSESLSKTMDITVDKYFGPIKNFFQIIINPTGKEKTNVYAYMFLCDFFNFLLLIFGFSAFGTQQGDGGVTAYFQENRVPMPFLLMLLLQFALIVIDRALFLRKYIVGKLIFQYCLVLGVHFWMFFILPSVTERQFNDNLAPQIWYMVKCFYLLLAAYQLRQGYPTRILGNFLCKKYNIVNYVLFKGFMLVPFLFELRAVMDWIWTDTSMTIMDWFKMEDIFASIYQLKCMRGVESDFPQPRGEKKKQMSKYLVGGSALFFIIGLIWFPLLLFALGSTVGKSNLPYDVSMKISIGPYEPIYSMSAQGSSIIEYTEDQYKTLTNINSTDRSAITFFENYMYSDVAAVRFSTSSRKLWSISPPDKDRLKTELASNTTMVVVHVEWTVSRKTDAKDATGITTTVRDIKLPPLVNGEFNPVRQTLVDMLNEDSNTVNATIIFPSAFPKFLKVTARTTSVVPQLMQSNRSPQRDQEDEDDSYLYRNVSIQLSTIKDCCAHQQWWVIHETCIDPLYKDVLSQVPLNDCNNYIMMFLFNDKAFPKELSFISGFGILGLYTTAVIVISQMMRKIVSDMAPKIMFDDLPYVDRILRLCLDIYLVRESGDLCLEEDLFAKLIFLYRSPETLIKWTRPPEEGERTDNEDQEGEEERQGEERRPEPSHRD